MRSPKPTTHVTDLGEPARESSETEEFYHSLLASALATIGRTPAVSRGAVTEYRLASVEFREGLALKSALVLDERAKALGGPDRELRLMPCDVRESADGLLQGPITSPRAAHNNPNPVVLRLVLTR